MKKAIKAVLSFTLSASMLLPLTACSKNGKKKIKVKEDDPYFDATTVKLELKLDEDKEVEYSDCYNYTYLGDSIMATYYVSYKMPDDLAKQLKFANPETEEEMNELMEIYAQYYQQGTVYFDLDGNVKKTVPQDMDSNEYTMSMKEGPNGNLLTLTESYEYNPETMEGKETYYLKEIDGNGDVVSSKEIPLDDEKSWIENFFVLDDGSTIFTSWGSIWMIDANGKEVFNMSDADLETTNIFPYEDKWYVIVYEHNEDYTDFSYYIQELDLKQGKLVGNKVDCNPSLLWNMKVTDDGIYSYNGNGIVKVDPLKNESEVILDWNATDVNYTNLQADGLKIYSDDKIAFITTTYEEKDNGDWESETKLITLTRAEKNPHAGKTVISLGIDGTPSEAFMDYIIRYNTNEDNKARMTVTDYSADMDYDDYEKAMAEMADKVYLEMIAGSGPDILVNFSSYSQFNSEDVLLDLNKYIDGKDGLNRDDYFDNVFRAFETRGKLFQIPVCVDIHGLLANKDLIGERTGWTYSEFNQIVSTLPDDVSVFEDIQYEDLLEQLLANSMNSFVDYSKKEVYFDSDEFKQILNIAKTYGTDNPNAGDDMGMYEDDGMYYDPTEKLDEGILAMMDTYIYTLQMYASNSSVCNGNAIFVGMPSADGSGMTAAPMLTLAIAAKSANKEEAWDFIKFMYDEDEQYEFSSSFYSIPLSSAAFDRVNESAIENSAKEVEQYEEMMEQMEGQDYYMGNYKPQLLTEEDAQGFRKLVESVSTIYSSDPAIMNIIKEEAAAFFSDQRSAEDVCKNIQDRTTTIVHER